MRHSHFVPLIALVILLVPISAASSYYHGSYTVADPLAYSGYDGCYWAKAGVYLTTGSPFGDNCVHLAGGAAGQAYSVNFNGSVVAPTIWHVCFWSSTPLSCGTGGAVPAGAAWFTFSAQDGVAVKWNMTVG